MILSLALAVGVCSIGSGYGAADSSLVQTQGDPEKKQTGEAAKTPPEPPDPPIVRLHPMAGFDDDAAYVRSIQTRVDALVLASEQATNSETRVSLLLEAANEILAHQLEPNVSRAFLFLPSDEDLADPHDLVSALDRAAAMLAQVASELNAHRGDGVETPTWLTAARAQHRTMASFSVGIRNLLLTNGQELGSDGARLAAAALAPLREESYQPVALAATLWQATLRHRNEDRDRAMASLAPALAKAVGAGRRYALFSRLLRCRLLADQGTYAVALALLVQLEELSVRWLADSEQHEQWIRTVHLLRIEILSKWYASLEPEAQAAERTWCVRRIERLKEDSFGPEHNTVMRLGHAIPILVSGTELPSDPPPANPDDK